MTYDLTRLGSREFEHLVQALAVAVFGPGASVFGSGKDGGREATFDGPVPYSADGHSWDGYGVVQAKHKERLDEPKKNAAWLLREIRVEFGHWDDSPERRTPNYYVLATNVVLSPVQDTGGIDTINAELAKRASKWGMRGFDVWHHDKIAALLDNHPEVADNYAAWITPSKLLTDLKDQLHRHFGNDDVFDAFARSYPARELIAQRYVNLDQAGRTDDHRIRLAQVFVDVPVELDARLEGELKPGVVQTIIDGCDRPGARLTKLGTAGRTVVIGGPGQGKSTVSQFLCQIYRRELLSPETMSPEVADEAEYVGQQLGKEGITPPAVRRWPIQIPLNRLADDLATNKAVGVLDHIAQRVAKQTEIEIRPEHCREWLRRYPWLVVLDGLDEVPASGNRHQLMEAIERFLADVHTVGADVFVVATTRPQGYQEEFAPQHYRHLELAPLPLETGLRYGEELIRLRTGDDGERIEQLIARLREAGVSRATAKLMETPLQVTILTVLISRMGEVPRHRYDLFNDYYGTIYTRELEKGSETARLLRDHQGPIDTLHNRVGLLLQKMGEESGESSAVLPVAVVRQLIRSELQSEELAGADLVALTDRIVEAATDRLVFLVAPREDLIGFEIRSLQEYCAARGIADCTDEEVIRRLETLAPSSYWRNVVLFVCGWIFFHRKHLRDSALVICDDLDSVGDDGCGSGPQTLPGARLALALAADVGTSITMPKYQRLFGVRAAQLLKLLPCQAQRELAHLPIQTLRHVIPFAEGLLTSTDPIAKAGVLRFAAALAAGGDSTLLERAWHRLAADGPISGDIAVRLGMQDTDPYLLNLAKSHVLSLNLADLRSMLWNSETRGRRLWQEDDMLDPALRPLVMLGAAELWMDGGLEIRVRHQAITIEFSLTAVDEIAESQWWADAHENRSALQETAWYWLVAVADFCRNPSEETLAAALRAFRWPPGEVSHIVQLLPWPIGAALLAFSTPDEAADAAAAGRLGGLDTWRARERAWRDGAIADVLPDFPIAVAQVAIGMLGESEDALTTSDILTLWHALPSGPDKDYLATVVLVIIAAKRRGERAGNHVLVRKDYEAIVAAASRADALPVNWIYSIDDLAEWADLVAEAGEASNIYTVFGEHAGHTRERRDYILRQLAALWRADESRTGIGRFISALLPRSGLLHALLPPLDFPQDANSQIVAEVALKTRQYEGWDAETMAELICADTSTARAMSFVTAAHPDFPALDSALLRILREKAWYLAARLQENMATTQGAAPVDTARFIQDIT